VTRFEYRAALLAGDAVGKRITVTYRVGAVESTVRDVVTSVKHTTMQDRPVVELKFRETRFRQYNPVAGLFGKPTMVDVPLELDPETIVVVES
jgi:hypothetical protein